MLARILLSALAALAVLSSGASAQTTGSSCSSSSSGLGVTESCTSTSYASNSNGDSATLSFGFTYCAPIQPGNLAYGTGQITSLQTGTGTLNVNIATPQSATSYDVTALTGTVTTGAPGSVTAFAVTRGQAPLLSFSSDTRITINGATVTLSANQNSAATAGVLLSGGTVTGLPSTLMNFNQLLLQESCTSIRGDPLFSGFRGQQFYVGGSDGQVMNMISTFNMQLNGRFVMLDDGAAIKPAEQEKLRLLSLARHTEQPEVAAFPRTTPWSHPGNYFGEAGVALLDNNRLYAKAGSFESGFAKVALNGRPLAVSSEFVVLGSGANTTYIQRVSAHEVMVRTVSVEFTLTNSDNFLNVEDVHLERGYRQHNQFSGLLGNTVDPKWTWNAKDEEAAIVQSNDLFAHEA